jgi:hypothetical protein
LQGHPASYRDPNPNLTPDLTDIEEEALLADDDNLNMNDNLNMDDSFEVDELYLNEIENQTTNKHEQNTGSPNTDEQHTNEPKIDQNVAEHTMDRTNNDEEDMDITEDNNIDNNSNLNISTNQHPSHNSNNMQDNTHNNIDFIDVTPRLLTSFKIIYGLKLRHSKLLTNLENLREHKRMNTLPPGLRVNHKSKYYMDKTFKDRWENILLNASLALLDTTIDYHEHCIQDTQHKLQHRTNELKKRCDEDLAQKVLTKTDTLYMKYTERSLLAFKKSTKQPKRLESTSAKKLQTLNNSSQDRQTKTRNKHIEKQIKELTPSNKPQMNITKQPQKTKHTQHPTNTPKTLRVIHTTHVNTTNTPQTTFTATYKPICIHGHITPHTALYK